MNKDMIVASR